MRKVYMLFIFTWFCSVTSTAQMVDLEWAEQMGAGSQAIGYANVTDASGNIYTVGCFEGMSNFGAGSGTLLSLGKTDAFVQKLNSAGTLLWSVRIGGGENDTAKSVCIIGSSLYVLGKFEGTMNIGSTVLTSAGGSDAFIVRISMSTGNISNARSFGGIGMDEGNGISPAGTSGLYLTGSFEGTADLDPNPFTSFSPSSAGMQDVFLVKADLNLNLLWARSIGGTGNDHGNAVSGSVSKVYFTGSFEGTADLDPGIMINNAISFGASDIFVVGLDAAGNFIWGSTTGDTNGDQGNSIKTDASGNIYILGDFRGNPDFDPGFTNYYQASNGETDIFLQKLDSLGNFVSAFTAGGTLEDHGYGLQVDNSGNVYCTGSFRNIADFDPGAGTVSISSAGLSDIFIQKTDAGGNLVFANSVEGSSEGAAYCIATDASGNIYTSGSFAGSADFDPGAGIVTLSGPTSNTFYVQKLNGTGAYQWAKASSSLGYNNLTATAVDVDGNIYNAGFFKFGVDFDPGPGTEMLYAAWQDIYIQKLDPAGNLLWVKSMVGEDISGNNIPRAISTDAVGNVYIAGNFYESVDFDPGPGTFILTGSDPGFIQKLDSSGNLIWVKIFEEGGSTSGVSPTDLVVDPSGDIYFTGGLTGTVDFDTGPGTYNVTTIGSYDIVVCKLNSSGDLIWVKAIGGGIGVNGGRSIALDNAGNICVAGNFSDIIDFDPGPGVYNIGEALGSSVFILKLGSTGDFIWARNIHGTGNMGNDALKLDELNNIYFSGYFNTNGDFDPGPATFNMSSSGSIDAFVEKLDPIGNFIWAKKIGGAESDEATDLDLDLFGNVYLTGYYKATVDFDPGPLVYNLNSPQISYFIEKLNNDGNWVWTQTTLLSGLQNAIRAHSICIDPPGNVYCGGEFYGTCDLDPGPGTYPMTAAATADIFFMKLGQCINNATLTESACESYTLNGTTYTATGIYGQMITASPGGCDSTVTIDLTINGPQNSVTQSSNTITADASGATYQWINCTTNMAIAGETSQSYNVMADGSYAVEISNGGCIDTSDCIPVVFTGIPLHDQPSVTTYPNPFEGSFTLEYNSVSNEPVNVQIMNPMGQIVYQANIEANIKHYVPMEELSKGVYFVKLYNDSGVMQKQVVKQ